MSFFPIPSARRIPSSRLLARKIGPSLFTFLAGTAGIIGVDLLIVRYSDPIDVDRWVALKTLVMFGGGVAMLGLDHVLAREPGSARQLMRWGTINILAFSALISVVALLTGYYEEPLWTAVLVGGAGLSTMTFALLRTRLRLNQAQFARDGWKILFLMLLPFYFFLDQPLEWLLAFALATCIAAPLMFGGAAEQPLRQVHHEVTGYRSALVAGYPFLLISAALAIGSYGELLLLRIFGSPEEVATYLRALILFSYPSLMLNAYLTAVFGPMVRQNPARATRLIQKSAGWMMALSGLIAVCVVTLGYFVEPLLFGTVTTPMWLAGLLAATGALRFFYIGTSAYIGALADGRQLRRIGIAYFAGALATVPLCMALLRAGFDVFGAVALASLCHWGFRLALGWKLVTVLTGMHRRTDS